MNDHELTVEKALYFLAFLLALVCRLMLLGQVPLGDAEAANALQALSISLGKGVTIASAPGYAVLTGSLFSILTSTEFLARLLPALAGSLLVFVPLLFRRYLDKRVAIILAFALALDGGLVALSRIASGDSFAVTFLLLAIGLFLNGNQILAGVCGGLALLGGPMLWPGVVGLGAAFLWSKPAAQTSEAGKEETPQSATDWKEWFRQHATFLVSFALTVLAAGTLFFIVPNGLNGIAGTFVAYLQGWWNGSQSSGVDMISRMLIALVTYSPLALVFGAAGLAQGLVAKDKTTQFLAKWLLVAFALTFAYPAKQTTDVIWMTLPLYAIAAQQVIRWFHLPEKDGLITVGYTVVVSTLLVFIWLGFLYFVVNTDRTSAEAQLRIAGVIGALVLIMIVSFLVVWGWSANVTGYGLLWSLTGVLVLISLGMTGRVVVANGKPETNLWQSSAIPADESLLTQTIRDLSQGHTEGTDEIDIEIAGADTPALRWAMRDFDNARFVTAFTPGSTPSLAITASKDKPALDADYRGQDFVIGSSAPWSIMVGGDWVRWLASNQITPQNDMVVLWARNDLFPDASGGTTP
jgi:hypothetical protein